MATKKQEVSTTGVYKGVNIDKLKGYSLPKRRGQSDWWKTSDLPDNDPSPIRVLPPVGEMELPWVDHFSHMIDGRYGKGRMWKWDKRDYEFSITCLEAHGLADECPICKVLEWAEQEDPDFAEGLAAGCRHYANVIVRPEPRVYSCALPPGIVKRMVEFFNGKAGDFFHPVKGRDLIVQKQVTGKRIRYQADLDIETSPIGVEGWETKAVDHTKSIRVESRDEILEIMAQNIGMQVPLDELFGLEKPKRGRKK